MKTSLTDIVQTEKYLRKELDAQESVLFEARLIVSDAWKANTFFHKMVHRLVHLYYRKKLKSEIEAVHDKLFHDPAKASFSIQVTSLFKR